MMRMIKRTKVALVFVVFAAMAIFFAACANSDEHMDHAMGQHKDVEASKNTSSDPNTVEQPGPNEVQIVIENFAFVPSELTITAGTKVTWINKDEAPHTATSTEKKFNSGGLDTDDKYSFVFNDKGEFPYFCTLHPHMTASITVK